MRIIFVQTSLMLQTTIKTIHQSLLSKHHNGNYPNITMVMVSCCKPQSKLQSNLWKISFLYHIQIKCLYKRSSHVTGPEQENYFPNISYNGPDEYISNNTAIIKYEDQTLLKPDNGNG